jgi:hypothetical protein
MPQFSCVVARSQCLLWNWTSICHLQIPRHFVWPIYWTQHWGGAPLIIQRCNNNYVQWKENVRRWWICPTAWLYLMKPSSKSTLNGNMPHFHRQSRPLYECRWWGSEVTKMQKFHHKSKTLVHPLPFPTPKCFFFPKAFLQVICWPCLGRQGYCV